MRSFPLAVMLLSFFSVHHVQAGNDLITTEANVRILINGEESYQATVAITDVVGDGNCGFYSSKISREKFYQRLLALYGSRHKIIDAIMGTFERPRNAYREQLYAWFENALTNDEDPWLNDAGLHLMSNLFSIDITTYEYSLILGQQDRTRLSRRFAFSPLLEIQNILLDSDIVIVEYPPIYLLNLGNVHWNRIVFLVLTEILVQAQAEPISIDSDTEESSSEEEKFKKQKKKKKKKSTEKKDEENSKKTKRKGSEEDDTGQKKVRTNDHVPNNNNNNNNNNTVQAQSINPNPNTLNNENSDWVSSCILF